MQSHGAVEQRPENRKGGGPGRAGRPHAPGGLSWGPVLGAPTGPGVLPPEALPGFHRSDPELPSFPGEQELCSSCSVQGLPAEQVLGASAELALRLRASLSRLPNLFLQNTLHFLRSQERLCVPQQPSAHFTAEETEVQRPNNLFKGTELTNSGAGSSFPWHRHAALSYFFFNIYLFL